MIPPLVLAALLATAPAPPGPDACAPVPGAAAVDRRTAAVYLAIADEERAAGRDASAVAAYRAALAADPGLPRARGALAALCGAARVQGALARGLAAVRAGDCRGALPDLDLAREAREPAAALLVGLCRYRLGGDDAGAEAALREAAATPATRGSAELFLGLLALRRGDSGDAARLLEAATADPALAPTARALAQAARQQGRVVASLLASSGWDSNADLTPGGDVAPSGSSAAMGELTGIVTVAPWRAAGPYARVALAGRGLSGRPAQGLLAVSAAAGVPLERGAARLVLEYGYDARRLGGHPYLDAHRVLADGRLALREGWSAGASYALRVERYRPDEVRGDSGVRHGATLDVTATAWRSGSATLGWQATADVARARERGYLEHGPVGSLTVPLGAWARAALEVAYTWRAYGAEDPNLLVRRRDGYLDGAARLEADLGTRFAASLTVAARRAGSNVEDYRSARLLVAAGLSCTVGVP